MPKTPGPVADKLLFLDTDAAAGSAQVPTSKILQTLVAIPIAIPSVSFLMPDP
jgi:hypothetical protein